MTEAIPVKMVVASAGMAGIIVFRGTSWYLILAVSILWGRGMTGGSFGITLTISANGIKAYLNGANPITLNTNALTQNTYAFGTGNGLVSVIVNQIRGLGPGQSETLTLYDGSLLVIYGDPAVFRTVRDFVCYIPGNGGGDANGLPIP